MSTRSYICKENEDGTYTGIYCHSDGYLTYNGAMLLDHYNDREKVEKLLSNGDMSILAENIDPNPLESHSFDNRQENVCVFYGRDRGETDTKAKLVNLEDIDKPDSWIEYCYVYGKDDKWKFFECGSLEQDGLKDLDDGLKEEYKELGFERPEGVYGFYSPEEIKELRAKSQQKSAEM